MKKISLLILLLLFSASNIAQANDADDYRKFGQKSGKCSPLFEAGLGAYDAGNFEAAMNFFEKAEALGCKDGLVYFNMGLYYEAKNAPNQALKYFRLANKHLGRYRKVNASRIIHEQLGRVLFSMGRYGEAKVELEKAVKAQGENFILMFLLGSIAKNEGNDQEIIKYYTKALLQEAPPEMNPQQLVLTMLVELGRAYYDLEDYAQSAVIWNKVLSIAPGHPIARKYKQNLDQRKSQDEIKQMEKQIQSY